ncbi:type IV pilus modification PilV family protein [Mesoterricola sediminis]|uniref:Prepilin-type N-terminal cleavage/methylation domain-containing protein n=1 Tax=Mesoterricola sediminis TaxID=2927980 RepID=A0AA48GTP6_9BACT|nr:prepilin-type N-terminal cleavage/methylation domain-containing protein [Mesoterricola sediminis]BDU77427.1 hypothetical protein METESE_23850 [Mesoterricola sediminis]
MRARGAAPAGQGGFTLVEFLLAAFILSIGLLGLAALQAASTAASTGGRGRVTASYVADQVLQQVQSEGQHSYFAKMNGLTPAYTALYTKDPGTSKDPAPVGGFNVDGVQVTTSTGAAVANLAKLVPDPQKRVPVYAASWARLAYQGTAPVSAMHSQEFVVNVTWTDGAVNRVMSMSRYVRY